MCSGRTVKNDNFLFQNIEKSVLHPANVPAIPKCIVVLFSVKKSQRNQRRVLLEFNALAVVQWPQAVIKSP